MVQFGKSAVCAVLLLVSSCKTKSEIRREQEIERIKTDLVSAKSTRADLETVSEDLKSELVRLAAAVDAQAAQSRGQNDELRKELGTLSIRLQSLEQRAAAQDEAAKKEADQKADQAKPTFANAKRAYDQRAYNEAIDLLGTYLKSKPSDAKRARLLLADALFGAKDYASAALEYGSYKKAFPKDSGVAWATYQMALSFKNLGQKKEARLFLQELLDRFPKSRLAPKAKAELNSLTPHN